MKTARKAQQGVTLVETLVALAVMGFVIGALLVLLGQNTRFASAMRDRTMASIAADNLMVEAMVLRDAAEIGESEGEVTIGGETLRYRRAVIETGVEDIVRIEIDILAPRTGQRLGHAVSMRRTS
ncbi:type II secretion system minor pseudopilin GspI [Hyphococcus sp.]|uniref:type II secretion system minor pseudopilin GspI n=1 Tax=Hyphococcus sp. TaxID=2038636 RepID=UPI0035C747EE